MKKGLRISVLLIITVLILIGKKVSAKEIYYTNSNGVSFTKEEYDFFTYVAWDGYQEYISEEMLEEIQGKSINDNDVKKVGICQNISSSKNGGDRNSNLEVITSAKTLTLSKYCTPFYCRAIVNVSWLGDPSVKSYDVIGSLIDGPTRLTTPDTLVTSSASNGTSHLVEIDEADGFGTVIQLPSTGDNIHITQSYLFQGTGIIYYSYQHAMFTISYQNSQLFNIDLVGYGNVLDFYGAAVGYYDDMPGVYMDV